MPTIGFYIPLEKSEKLTKAKTLEIFEQSVLPGIKDKIGENQEALKKVWGDFTHALQRDGHLTKRQAETWVNPYDP